MYSSATNFQWRDSVASIYIPETPKLRSAFWRLSSVGAWWWKAVGLVPCVQHSWPPQPGSGFLDRAVLHTWVPATVPAGFTQSSTSSKVSHSWQKSLGDVPCRWHWVRSSPVVSDYRPNLALWTLFHFWLNGALFPPWWLPSVAGLSSLIGSSWSMVAWWWGLDLGLAG